MRAASIGFILLLSAPIPAMADKWPTKPDPSLTPGETRPLSVSKICSIKWGTDARHVTQSMKDEVIAAYNFDVKACPLTKFNGSKVQRVEIDHLISRELGGADSVKNLWPECYEQVEADKSQQDDGAHKKDRLENELHKRLCANPSAALLKRYQKGIATDWIALYQEVFGDD